jgi:tetratricopeptide (TPR) repeat protein
MNLPIVFEEVRRCEPLPSPWRAIVKRCLEPSAEDRFSSVDEVMERLARRNSAQKWTLTGVAAAALLAAVLWVARPAPSPPVRLAVLPVVVDGAAIPTAAGLAVDVADRLSGLRRGLVVIPPGEALRDRVDTPEKAKSVLSATHALRARLRNSGGQIAMMASIVDTGSGRVVEELNGNYHQIDIALMAKALTAMVTGGFHLRIGVPMELVTAAAYPFYIQGINLLRGEQVNAEGAISFFEKAIELDPGSALPYAGLAEAELIKFQQGKGHEWLERAERSIAKAQSLNADSVPVLLAAGLTKDQYGWYERAAQDFSRAIELAPNNSEAWKRLAGAYSNMNRPEDAIATYQKAIQAQPDYYAPYFDLGLFYYLRGDCQQAEPLFRRAVEIAPGFSRAHMDLGLALRELGRYQEAEQSLLTALRLQETLQVLTNIGAFYYHQERFQEAAQYFEKSLNYGPDAIAYEDLGDANRHLGRLQAAATAYHAAQTLAEEQVAQNPREPFARARLARISALLGERRRAEFEITQALSMNSGMTRVIRAAALTYETLGEREKTLQVLTNAPWRVVDELSRQPDVSDLQRDPRFQELLRSKAAQR